ncbi:uncharacterized protein LOC123368523 isoform X1 [Mauremys mutica]|uniref:uncharacterized protein LOC123368523 isoform X1 n=1 Tax=Mauremys mutica TaxID=74926 RepID=UPI001D169A99|nr:uncharacterized protein LOC123368523 isoform X1 [Mauremys mutica]XP_044869311.1 uncharacterized protein LOC123368523 isoform X1 [Mauremys mutica]XP_044869312.1 uncharacterized protein LOC123368523 isoform X1 [Mauremys mutica]
MLGFCSCACRGIVQESQTEQKLEEVDLSSLDILRRHEQSSAFCLLNNCLFLHRLCASSLVSWSLVETRPCTPGFLPFTKTLSQPVKQKAYLDDKNTVQDRSCSAEEKSHMLDSTALMRWKASERDETASSVHARCACKGIVLQEPQPRENLAEMDVSSLDILLKRHEQSSAFSLLHNYTSLLLGARLKPKINAGRRISLSSKLLIFQDREERVLLSSGLQPGRSRVCRGIVQEPRQRRNWKK